MRIGLGQMDCLLGDIESNLATMHDLIKQARLQNVDLLVFPELALTGYAIGQVEEDVSLRPDDPRIRSLLQAAGEMSLVFGFHEDAGHRSYNSAAYTQAGELVHVHRKLYLPNYGPFEERKHFSPGQHMRSFTTRHGDAAMLICNDAWQPVLPFIAVQDGAQLLIIPTNSSEKPTSDGVVNNSYWYEIVRFHARIYESYVIFVNRVGHEHGLNYWGGSHVVAPSGETMAQAQDSEAGLTIADIDLAEVTRWRRRAPLVREARLAMLSREFERLAQSGGDL